jgi:hypothetical protein
MQFTLDMWEMRNDVEHDTEGEPIKEKKRKIIDKILWGIDQIGEAIQHPYEDSTYEELIELPLQNLQIIDAYVNPKKWKWHIQEHKKMLKEREESEDETDEDEESSDGTDMYEEYST